MENDVELTKSARRGDLSNLKRLLDLGIFIETKDENGWTALHAAAYEGYENIVNILLNKGAEVNARTKEEQTPLMMAAYKGSMSILENLINHGAEVNDKDIYGWTPLMFVTIYKIGKDNYIELASRLLEKGADPSAVNKKYWDASRMALKNGMVELEQLIEQYTPKEDDEETGLLYEYIRDLGSDYSDIAKVKIITLVEVGENINQTDPITGGTVIDMAARNNNVNAVKLLLEQGADPDIPDKKNRTPLINSAVWGRTEVLKVLISHGANINSIDILGGTALDAARDDNNIVNVKILIEAGADVNARDVDGNTPLMKAVLNKQTDIEKLLLQSGADPNLKNKYGHTLQDMRQMSKKSNTK